MALNTARAGHVYPAYRYEVCREKVVEYCRATSAPSGPYEGADESTPPPPVPPTFAACITGRVVPMVVDDPELGGHWNLLHTGQTFRFSRPVHIGDALRCVPRIDTIVGRRRMDVLTIAVEVTDPAGDIPVFTATSTIVFSAAEEDVDG